MLNMDEVLNMEEGVARANTKRKNHQILPLKI